MDILGHIETLTGASGSILLKGQRCNVYTWQSPGQHGMSMLCTVGMSDKAQAIPPGLTCPSAEPRTELLCHCYPKDSETVGRLLVDLADYPFRHHKFVFWWHTLALGRPLLRDASIEGVLFAMPPYSSDQVTFIVDHKRRDLLWVVPLCGSELEFCRKHGVDRFESMLETADVDLADLGRSAVV